MARIRLLEKDEMDPEMAGMVDHMAELVGDTTALRAIAHRPDIVKSFGAFYWPLQMDGLLSRKLVELVRFAVAQVNQCPNCLGSRYQDSFDEGLTEEMIAALPNAETSPLFDERERAAIAFGQQMAFDHFGVDDTMFARLHRSFSEKELVELCFDVAQFVGIGRMFAVLDATNTACQIPAVATRATAEAAE
ncbi:carboxymuconolactone decarboxylase family protein [Croceicoccus sp. BE223]|uniref:carboxymuconolactone decarboxylase family protein n=1 Tax=Croceicoccus sp. BE223 TaxID=2817716 RepID=UPI0028545958|nr:carboxymuconolactone decarboxylase family protein [Croceicoccus sp. BE223]MDR7104101.1 AhpD family alkylhydroperoxidase [Croceicoccus sp. BE223]